MQSTIDQSNKSVNPLYGMTGKLKTKEGKSDEVVAILMKASKLVSEAKGIHLYLVCKDVKAADTIWVIEAWDTKEDHDNSLTMMGVKELIARAMPLIDGKPEGVILDVIGGKGV